MISNARRKKIFVTFVFFAAILMLMGALTAAESGLQSTVQSSNPRLTNSPDKAVSINVKFGNITLTGNPQTDFGSKYIVAKNINTAVFGNSGNLTNVYVANNQTDLFLGINGSIGGNSLMVFLSNNTNSGLGSKNLTNLALQVQSGTGDGLYINSTFPINWVGGAYFPGSGGSPSNYMDEMITTPVSDSGTTSQTWNYIGSSTSPVFSVGTTPTNAFAEEWAIPLSTLIGNSFNGWTVNLSAFVFGGHQDASVGIPYDQVGERTFYSSSYGEYSSGAQVFEVNNSLLLHLSPSYNVTFTQSGLPSGTPWYVNITNGQSYSSTGSTLSFYLENGTYTYTYATANKTYTPTVYGQQTLSVSGSAVSVPVSFKAEKYMIKFTETGLPTGVQWYVNLSNGVDLNNPAPEYVSISIINGSYTYTVSSADPAYVPSPRSGSVLISGHNHTVNVTFTKSTYPVYFFESGLPNGVTWYVNFTSGLGLSSSTNQTSTDLSNGTYAYKVASSDPNMYASPSSGNLNVKGVPLYVHIIFTNKLYAVMFTETGLPSGSEWYVNVTNNSGSTTYASSFSQSLSVYLANGSYDFTYSTSNKIYTATVYAAQALSVDGSPSGAVMVSFRQVNYTVTFHEMNLPAGTYWTVSIATGPTLRSNMTAMSVNLTNGTYTYSVTSTDASMHATGGMFSVPGASISVTVTFQYYIYPVTFSQSGLPAGSIWYVNVSGMPTSGPITGSNYMMNLHNGSFSLTVSTSSKNYQPSSSNPSSVTVDGSTMVSLKFVPVTFTVTFSESGLVSSAAWFVNISNGVTTGMISGSYGNVQLQNGTYTYTVASMEKTYRPSAYTGIVIVSGSSVTVSVSFVPVQYSQVFFSYNIQAGAVWSLTIDGHTYNVSGNSISVSLQNGSYSYTAKYGSTQYNGTLAVKGAGTITSFDWGYVSVPSITPSQAATISYIGIAVIVILAIVALVAVAKGRKP